MAGGGGGGGGSTTSNSGSYPNNYRGGGGGGGSGGGKTYRHKGRSKSATKYVEDKPKKKKKSSATSSSNSVSLVSIPNTIKLSMLNSGLLPLCKLRSCLIPFVLSSLLLLYSRFYFSCFSFCRDCSRCGTFSRDTFFGHGFNPKVLNLIKKCDR